MIVVYCDGDGIGSCGYRCLKPAHIVGGACRRLEVCAYRGGIDGGAGCRGSSGDGDGAGGVSFQRLQKSREPLV
jgi:hypothetical protein